MRTIIFIVIITVIAIISSPIYAQTETTSPTASPSASVTEGEIQDFKDKIATKVAELRKKNQKAVAGVIISIEDNVLTLKTDLDEEYQIKYDETLSKIYVISTSKKEIAFKDLKKGSYIIVTGPLFEKTIDANYIYQDEQYIVQSGKITEVNRDDFVITLVTAAKESVTLDIENQTLQQMLNAKTLALEKMGFSKMKEGDTIHFVAKRSAKEGEQTRYSATKTIIIPQEYFQK